MIREEKRKAIEEFCDELWSQADGDCAKCPLYSKAATEHCFSGGADIDRNYSIIFGNDEVDRKNDEIETTEKVKIKTHFAEIKLGGTPSKPYFYIEYYDPTDGAYHEGFGSYEFRNVEQWLKEEFEIVNNPPKTTNDEIKPADDEIEFVKVAHEEAEAEERGRVTEKKIISTALHGYGAGKQRVKCIEELAELQKEICKDLIGCGSQFHIAEEIADVEIVIAQMKIYYGCARDVAAIKAQKLKQLAKNLGMESDED